MKDPEYESYFFLWFQYHLMMDESNKARAMMIIKSRTPKPNTESYEKFEKAKKQAAEQSESFNVDIASL